MMLLASIFTSCQFGDDVETQLSRYDNKVRQLDFAVTASRDMSGSSDTRTTLTDNGLDGVDALWEANDQMALLDFGQVFTTDYNAQTLKSPYAICMTSTGNGGETQVGFEASARAVISINPDYEYHFALLYPYKAFRTYTTDASTVELDFSGQDGSLDLIAESYQYAWGYTKAKVGDKEITLTDAISDCANSHDHSGCAEGELIMDNKMALMRVHLNYTVTAADITKGYTSQAEGTTMTLNEYLESQNLEVSEIVVENIVYTDDGGSTVTVPNIQTAELDLATGVTTEGTGSSITLNPVKVVEVSESDRLTSDDVNVWGTVFYLAVPCPTVHKLDFHPFITVRTKDKTSGASGQQTFFGQLSRKTLTEGKYYITGRLCLSTDAKKLNAETDIFLYYPSSFVWSNIPLN